jgi:hypothetical protein
MPKNFRPLLCSALVGACAFAQAQTTTMPPMQGQGAVQYVCGGIGSDESTVMRAAMKDHPLSLLFAQADGAYTADVGVTIKNASGATALAMRASGPVCLIDIPAGRYTIEATAEGVTKRQSVTLGASPRTADFRF